MSSTQQHNKRIAKNTLMLYFRMILTMLVSLYTSRVILNTLGVEDYGIYNVVGGFVVMFGFLNNAMASSTQRFLTFEIGKNDRTQLRNVFNMSVNIHILISLMILVFAETVGIWFVNTQLTIPPERMEAARFVYHFSVLALIVKMISVPYNAMIIAHERMNVYAWVSIIEVSLSLLVVFMLQWFGFDKLKFYAILMFGVALLIRIIYGLYCNRKFSESKFQFYWDRPLFNTLISYAGWNLWGNAAGVIKGQGVNVLLNIFFGPVINAARGIAYQVSGAINQFVSSFQLAINPQIIKSYAYNDLNYMHQLIFRGAKFSFFFLFIISLPIMIETDLILKLWLKNVPEYTAVFTRLVIINALIDSISGPLMTAAQASGKIKLYQSVVGGLLVLCLPLSYLFLKLGFSPEITLYISIGISIIALYARLKIISPLVKLNIFDYIKEVILKIIPVVLISVIIPIIIINNLQESYSRFFISGFSSLIIVGATIYYVGLEKSEQLFVNTKLKEFYAKLKF